LPKKYFYEKQHWHIRLPFQLLFTPAKCFFTRRHRVPLPALRDGLRHGHSPGGRRLRPLLGKSQRGHFQHIRGKSLAILLFPGVEIIDFAPEYEIFGQAGVRVFTVAPTDSVVTTAMGLRILPDYHFGNAPAADILLLPGGHVDHEDGRILDWVKKAHTAASTTLTVCNGAYFLASAGLLDGLEATTFHGLLDDLQRSAPKVKVVRDRRFVDNGKIVTSAGLASGIDAAFHILSEYEGVGRAQEVATFLEYDWDAEGRYVRAQLADRHLRPLDDALAPFLLSTLKYEGDRSQWSLEVLVTPELISIERIAQLLEHQWKSGTSWKKGYQKGLDSEWYLRDETGQAWAGKLQFSPQEKGWLVRAWVEKK
jgi:putative intracellular protease/amidase